MEGCYREGIGRRRRGEGSALCGCGGVRVRARDRGMCDGSLAGIRWRGTV